MKLHFRKTHPAGRLPTYATEGASAFDLYAATVNGAAEVGDVCYPGHPVIVDVGWAVEVPDGHMLQIASRSGFAFKHSITAFPGVIDSDYRGAVKVMLMCHHLGDDEPPLKINPGDRIAQAVLVPTPRCVFELVDDLGNTQRGADGFGSTGQ